ncbi:SusC/RagA family TonB-linked outer membrane protein [Mucilaginibacter pocheonensis]|uniref:TonB-linked SusC/RagA family outer membrane protein n=1 Tax=Mucilaginibacter pocheonensis TaxID=398050 RepID=A0ABU1T6T6_9SPHI|nr:TonB-dependent receptor [Mucilaginibacter pocheonensis]MDR6941048.1 TonB-linked SusC/RagA family outer membrane protein [Mucilaginibacter pocheonensis]
MRKFYLLIVQLLVIFQVASAQEALLTGTITNSKKEPLVGASVHLKGTETTAITGNGGKFSLKTTEKMYTVIITYIGYKTQEYTLVPNVPSTIILESSESSLSEVIVVGYGTQRKIESTGSIASVKAADLVQTPVANMAQGLQARVSGMQVNQNTGSPGGNISVRIRGTNSINGASEPLYVVDGIQISNGDGINSVSPLSTINPGDIESIEVLKDASASAIYGARAANGVVLITTKRGKTGVTRVTFDSYYGSQQVTKKLPVLNAAQFAQLENEVFKNNFYPNPAALGEGVNWQDLIFRKAPIQNHQLSINGGNDKTQLALSFNYFNQKGIIVSSDFKRYSLRLNLDHRVSGWLKVGTSILGSYSINNAATTGSTAIGDGPVVTGSILGSAIGAPPTLQPYRSDGSVFPFGEQAGGQYREVTNPLGFTAVLNQQTIKRTLANVYGEATIFKGLTYRASFNVDIQGTLGDYYSPRSIISRTDLNDNSGSAQKNNNNYTSLLHESILTYTHRFAENHSFKATAVYATQVEMANSNSINATGFPNDVTRNEAVQLALARTVSSNRNRQQLDSYLLRLNYGYKDKYFLDVTARADGSSKFGANNKYGIFPAVSGAWRIGEEEFLKDVSWVSDLKLRASYGITGNAGGISPYQSLSLVAATGSDYNFNHGYLIGINPVGIANPDLKWERSTQTDVGLDIGLFDNRLSLIADYYFKKTNDLLYVQTLPLSSGYSSITGNFASLQNKGFEFAANARILEGAFKWSLSANITFNKNKVLSLDGGVTNERFITNTTLLKVGSPLGVFKTYVFDGINQTGDVILPGYDGRTGGYKVKDINGDGTITSADQTITGDPNPDFFYGFSTNFSYKKFDLSAFFSGTYGNQIYNASRLSFEMPLGQRNMFAGLVNRWSPTNPSNEYVSGSQGGRLQITDHDIENGSYLRCKNITLGYTLPKIKGIKQLRIYVSGNNLFTVTKYSGFDPEVNTYAGSNTAIGIDNLVYPQARSFLGGIQLTF